MITFEPFWALMKERGISIYALEYDYELNPAEISRLKNNHNFTLKSIERFCNIFSIQPGDMLAYYENTTTTSSVKIISFNQGAVAKVGE